MTDRAHHSRQDFAPSSLARSSRGKGETLLALLLGIAVFYAAFGFGILDTASIGWLMHGDPAQHYFGWAFFRIESWGWPPGLLSGLAAPLQTSIVFTDSIPLLALPLKALSPLLPTTFQYFGLWMLSCYMLLALFAWRLLARLHPAATGAGTALRTLGVLLVLLSPPLLLRGYGHEALMAHWLILAAIEQTLQPHRSRRWALWLGIAILTHAYLAVMVAAFWFASFIHALIHALIQRTPSLPRLLFGSLILWSGLFTLAYLAGYVVPGSSQLVAQGYGHYSANLLTYFDPMNWHAFLEHFLRDTSQAAEWSRLLPSLGHAHHDQYEGFAYLGLGGLLAFGSAIVLSAAQARVPPPGVISPATHEREPRPELRPAIFMAVILFILSLSTTITFGSHTLFIYHWPAPLQHILEIFRASGRFAWPLYYLILILSITVITQRLRARHALPILSLIVGLQLYDLSPKFSEFHQHHNQTHIENNLFKPQWEGLLKDATHLIVLPRPQGDDELPWVQLALAHRLSLNLGTVARADNDALYAHDQAIQQALASPTAQLPLHSIIVITDENIPVAPQHPINTDPAHPTWRIVIPKP